MSNIWPHITHMSDNLYSEWVMSHIWMRYNVTHVNEWVLFMSRNPCHPYEWAGVCLHVTNTSAWVLLLAVNKYVTHTNEDLVSDIDVWFQEKWKNRGKTGRIFAGPVVPLRWRAAGSGAFRLLCAHHLGSKKLSWTISDLVDGRPAAADLFNKDLGFKWSPCCFEVSGYFF